MTTDGPAGGRGKWSQAGVPKKGWVCVDIEDLGEPSAVCEMCESSTIRFVHYMENDRYDDALRCGCVCAGNMENDLVAAERREQGMRSRASKRKRWADLSGWRMSDKGTIWIERDGYRCSIIHRDGQWLAGVKSPWREALYWVKRNLQTPREAKLAAFDKITQIERKRSGPGVI